MVRFSFRKKQLEKENAPSKPTKPANVLGRLLGVLRYIGPFFFSFFFYPRFIFAGRRKFFFYL